MAPGDRPEYGICEIFRGDHAVGLGFAIARKYVATCAHVVNSALGRPDRRDPARPGAGNLIRLRFAIGTTPGDDGYRTASVAGWLPAGAGTFDTDDIAVLELTDSAPAHVCVLRPVRYQASMRVQMWGPQPGRPGGGHVRGELLGEVRGGRIQISVSDGRFRVRPGFSGGPVWGLPGSEVAGVLSACGAEDDATDAYLLLTDRIRAAWPGWPPDEPAKHKPPAGDGKEQPAKQLIIRRLHAESLQSAPFTVLIDGTEEDRVLLDGETATFSVTPGTHKIQVRSGEFESAKRTVLFRRSWTMITEPRRASGPMRTGPSFRPPALVLRPQGEAAMALLFGFVFACVLLCGLLYVKNVSFADYVTDQWHWYGSPWSVAAGDCLHNDTQTYSSEGPMVVVPCSSAAADYTLLGVFADPGDGTSPGCEYVPDWSAAAGGVTVLGADFAHSGEILCAMPR